MRPALRAAAFLTVAFCAFVSADCRDANSPVIPESPTPGTLTHFTGQVDGSDAFVAFVVDGRRVQAYVSDGRTIAAWFTRRESRDGADYLAGDASGVTASDNASRLRLQEVSSAAITGEYLAPGSTPLPFRATPVADSRAGLYRSEEKIDNEDWVGGWILAADGQVRGALVRNRLLHGQSALRPAAVRLTGLLAPVTYRN